MCQRPEQPMDVDNSDDEDVETLTLSPAQRQARNRESLGIRSKASSSNVVLHSAMLVHRDLGNKSAQRIHKKLIDDPNCMDDYFNPQKSSVRKLTPLQAAAFLLHHVSTAANFPEML